MFLRSTTLSLVLVLAATTTTLSSASPADDHGLARRQGRAAANNGTTGTVGCWAHERDALLEFKKGITSDPAGRLASWHPGGHQDCCRWRGIRCSSRTGHVVGVHLRNVNAMAQGDLFAYYYNDTALVGEISPSLLSLQHLKHLDLSLNNLQGPTTCRYPKFLGSFKNLRYLNLSSIPFCGRVPPQLGNLTKLQHLDLSDRILQDVTKIKNSTDISWLTRLPSLQYLSMESIDLSMVLDWAQVVNMIPSLEALDLRGCGLESANQSLPHLNLINLERLDVSSNVFQHPVASCWFWNLTSLRYLGLGSTSLYGQFHHDALGGMTSLQVLDLSASLSSPDTTDGTLNIMSANMRNLCNLEILDFSDNSIGGNVADLFNRLPQCSPSKLRELHLGNNNFTGVIQKWIGRWSSLLILDLSNSDSFDLSGITGPLPSEIGMLNSLLTLDLSNNKINGPLPSEIGMLGSLLTLDLSNNLIIGSVPSEISTFNNLSYLYLGGNNFNGVITQEFLAGLTSLTEIDLSSNSLKIVVDPDWLPPFSLRYADFASCEMGPRFPTWLQSQVEITYLDISSAAISDNLPAWFGTTFSNAWKVNISQNGVSGTLPTNMEAMTSLERLYLNSNNLTGQIPRFPDSLHVLDISRNALSGPLPSNFGAPYIIDLRLFSNRITGHVPQSMCPTQLLPIILDLADNLLEGEFPECFHPDSFQMLILSNNRFSGKFPPSLRKSTALYILDLESNNFNGELPMWIGDMVSLEIVRLGHNNFSGSIPATITNLKNLLHLDLASNSISGVLPRNLSNLRGMTAAWSNITTFGHYLPVLNMSVRTKGDKYRYYKEGEILKMVIIDLSSNFLTGEIPEEITSLYGVQSLDLSRNCLTGKIPTKIGIMQALESLDLSENKLYGELPQSLSDLTYLSYLDLSYNNLTGRIPSGRQLDTLYLQNPFMYYGNSGLCGQPLHKNCSGNSEQKRGDATGGQHDSKLMPFPFGLGVGFVVGLWVVFCVMLFRKSWRIAYFRLFDTLFDKVYVFVVVTLVRWTKRTVRNR